MLNPLLASKSKKEKHDADMYWVKTLATDNLKETPIWSHHADEFVNKIFDVCFKDHAPFGDKMITKTRSLTDIL